MTEIENLDWPQFFAAAEANAHRLPGLRQALIEAERELSRVQSRVRQARQQVEQLEGYGKQRYLSKLHNRQITIISGTAVGFAPESRSHLADGTAFVADHTDLSGKSGVIDWGGDLSRERLLRLTGFALSVRLPGQSQFYLIRPTDCRLVIGEIMRP